MRAVLWLPTRPDAVCRPPSSCRKNSPRANLTEGFLVAPEAAAAYAGYKRLLEKKFLERNESVVVFLTGSGYKYLDQFGSWSVE